MKNIITFFSISLFFIVSIGMVSAADPTNLYVDVNQGNDLNDGSQAHPWRTINHAAGQVNPGDTVLIADGTYSITENIHITTSGTSSNPVIFRGIGNGVVIDGSGLDGSAYSRRDAIFIENADYVIIQNLEIKNAYRAGIRVSESDHVTIRDVESHDNGNWGIFTGFSNYLLIENCECYGSRLEHGIYTSNSGDSPIIRGNRIHDNHGCGLHMNGDISMGGDGVISNALVENNIIYNNGVGGGSGINCDGVQDSIIRNNLLYNNHASGISLYCIDGGAASNNNQVYHNTVIVASNGRWALNLKDGSSQNRIYNNIFLNNNPNRGSITTDSIVGLKCDNNIITTNQHPVTPDDESTYPSFGQWQALGFDQHSFQATPEQIFNNPASNDYSLKLGSVAVDNGTAQHTCSRDILGNIRPSGYGVDMGAYELLNPAPIVINTDPAHKAVNVPRGKEIKVTFSINVKEGTNFWVELKNSAGTSIAITKTILGNILTVKPTSQLPESKYTLCLHTGCVTDMNDNPLKAYSSQFSVGNSPYLTSSNPKNGATKVARNKTITLTFNENIKKSSNCWIELKSSSGKKIPITINTSSKTLTIKHSQLLAAKTRYNLYLHTGCITDQAGNPLKLLTRTFTAGNS